MSSYNYGSLTVSQGNLTFSGISVSETDVGTTTDFINPITGIAPNPLGFTSGIPAISGLQ